MLSFFKTSLKRGIRIRDEVVRSDTWVQRKAWLWLFILIDEESFCASGILRHRMEKATIHMNLYVLALSEYQTNQLTRKKKKRIPNNQLQENKFLCNHGSIHPPRLMFPVPKISQHTLNFPLEWVKKFWAVLTWRHITKFSRNPYTYRSWSHGRYFWLCEIWNGKRSKIGSVFFTCDYG